MSKGTVTLFESESYLVWKDTDEGMIHLIMAKRDISFLFCEEEWHEFARATVAAANKDCELNEADMQARIIGGTELEVIKRLIRNTIKPLQDRIDELEREWHEPIECAEDICKDDVKGTDEPLEATDEGLIDESHDKASILPEWGFLARIARIKKMLIRVVTESESRVGYFVGVGSNDGLYSILEPDDGGTKERFYYKDITSIEFLGDDQ